MGNRNEGARRGRERIEQGPEQTWGTETKGQGARGRPRSEQGTTRDITGMGTRTKGARGRKCNVFAYRDEHFRAHGHGAQVRAVFFQRVCLDGGHHLLQAAAPGARLAIDCERTSAVLFDQPVVEFACGDQTTKAREKNNMQQNLGQL